MLMTDEIRDESAAWGWRSPGESRWPATSGIVIAIALQALVPDRLLILPQYSLPALEALLLAVLIAANPSKIDHLSRDMRWLSLTLIVVLTSANLTNLVVLLHFMIESNLQNGRALIQAAVGIWATNVLAFAFWFWELDRGGPVSRARERRRQPDFFFQQMDSPDTAPQRWVPRFIDYAYVSLTNSLAFSPTDTLPLTVSAKTLMAAESLISIATIVVVGARAVNILS
jgi:hypothetical protein